MSVKNVFIIIKTCSATGGYAPDPSFGEGFLPHKLPTRGYAPGPRWGTSVPRPPNYLRRLSSFPPDRRGLEETPILPRKPVEPEPYTRYNEMSEHWEFLSPPVLQAHSH